MKRTWAIWECIVPGIVVCVYNKLLWIKHVFYAHTVPVESVDCREKINETHNENNKYFLVILHIFVSR